MSQIHNLMNVPIHSRVVRGTAGLEHFPCGCSPTPQLSWAFSVAPLHGCSGNPGNRENALNESANEAGGECDDGADKFERSSYRNADQAKRQQEHPDDPGEEHDRNQGSRPAHYKQEAPEQELPRFFFPSRGRARTLDDSTKNGGRRFRARCRGLASELWGPLWSHERLRIWDRKNRRSDLRMGRGGKARPASSVEGGDTKKLQAGEQRHKPQTKEPEKRVNPVWLPVKLVLRLLGQTASKRTTAEKAQ